MLGVFEYLGYQCWCFSGVFNHSVDFLNVFGDLRFMVYLSIEMLFGY